jgi:hypothetical protein
MLAQAASPSGSVRIGIVGAEVLIGALADVVADTHATGLGAGRRPRSDQGLTAADVAARSDVVISWLGGRRQLERAALGTDGIVSGLAASTLWIEMSCVSSRLKRSLASQAARRGASFLDVAMCEDLPSPRRQVLVGGEIQALDRARGILGRIADDIVHVGPIGSAVRRVGFDRLAVACALAWP